MCFCDFSRFFFFSSLVLNAAPSNEQWQPHLGGGWGGKKGKRKKEQRGLNLWHEVTAASAVAGKQKGPVCGATLFAVWLPVSGQIIPSKRRCPRPSAPLPLRPSAPPPFPQRRRRDGEGLSKNDKWSVGVQTGAALAPHAATFCVPPLLFIL